MAKIRTISQLRTFLNEVASECDASSDDSSGEYAQRIADLLNGTDGGTRTAQNFLDFLNGVRGALSDDDTQWLKLQVSL